MELEDYEDYELIEELITRGRVSCIDYTIGELDEQANMAYSVALVNEINKSGATLHVFDGDYEYGVIPLLHLTEDWLLNLRNKTGVTLN